MFCGGPRDPGENLNLCFSQRLVRLKVLTVDLSFLSPPWKPPAGRGGGVLQSARAEKAENKAALFEGGGSGGSPRVSFSVSSQSLAGPEVISPPVDQGELING